MAATLTTLADEAGVTPAVISRFLRGDPTLRISAQRRQRILEARERLGGIKVRRRRNRQGTRTVLMPMCRIFSADLIRRGIVESTACRAFEGALKTEGYRLHLAFFDQEEQASFLESTVRTGQACDGLVLFPGLVNIRLTELLREYAFPHVSWVQEYESLPVNNVRPDTIGGLRQAVDHLRELGHRRLAFAGTRNAARYPLLAAVAAAAGLPLEESSNCWIESPAGPTGSGNLNWRLVGREAMDRWLDRAVPATALVCHNDEIALGAIQAMKDRGLRPGRDLSIIGYDNIEVRGSAPVDHPILTTIDNPTDRIGKRAAELMLNQILHNQSEIVHERLPAPLIVRESTGKVI